MEITVLKRDPRRLQAKLDEVRQRMERRPTSWVWLEQVGRILRALDDPEAGLYFRRAIDHTKIGTLRGSARERAGDLMRVGNLYRLLGDAPLTTAHFFRARDRCREDLEAKRGRQYADLSLEIIYLIQPCYLVGCDDEVAELIDHLRRVDSDTDLRVYTVAKLAAARGGRDLGLVAEAVNEFACLIRKNRASLWDTGGVSLWDWYEIAVELWQTLRDESDPGAARG